MQRDPSSLLLVERDGDAIPALLAFLRRHAIDAVWVRDGESAFNALNRQHLHALVFALQAPRIDGLAVLRRARERHPGICAVAIGEAAARELADEAVRLGAADVQIRPVHPDRLLAVIERGLEQQRLVAKLAEMETRFDRRFGLERLDARSREMRRVVEQVRQVAATRAPVLIEGEAGTGKARLAEIIHQNSPRRGERFVRLSCSALPESAIEHELFGAERAATGEDEIWTGRIELATGGTLFLEDVERLPAPVQLRLLRLLQDRVFERIGGVETRPADVRLVAASTLDLEREVAAGRFREDLCARISLVRIRVPALRARREDVPALVATAIREFNREHGRRVTGVTPGVLERLVEFAWPGNVTELRDAIESMVVFAEGRRPIDLSDLPLALRGTRPLEEGAPLAAGMTVEEAERALISATLRHTGFDKGRAAAMLGIGLRTLYRKIGRYGLPERS